MLHLEEGNSRLAVEDLMRRGIVEPQRLNTQEPQRDHIGFVAAQDVEDGLLERGAELTCRA
jgi:hypothetical protein